MNTEPMKLTVIKATCPDGYDEVLVRIVAPDGTLIPPEWVEIDFRSTDHTPSVWTPAHFWPGSTVVRHE